MSRPLLVMVPMLASVLVQAGDDPLPGAANEGRLAGDEIEDSEEAGSVIIVVPVTDTSITAWASKCPDRNAAGVGGVILPGH